MRTIEVSRDVRWVERQSFYTEYGDWFVLVCAALVAFSFAALKIGSAPNTSA